MLLLAAGALGGAGPAWCQSPGPTAPPETTGRGLGSDIKLYFTAPLRWERGDWAWFGGALIAIGASHHYDTQVRTHFIKSLGTSQTTRSKDLQDALPNAAVGAATWAYANLISDSAGRREAWAVIESAALSTAPLYAVKYAVVRERPDRTGDP